jgi:hypothetical protein
MNHECNEAMMEMLTRGHCPICAKRGFVLGPMGGSSINIECANVECRRRFSVATMSGEVLMAQQIERRGEGGPVWPSEPPLN